MLKLVLVLLCASIFCECSILYDGCEKLKQCILPTEYLEFYYQEGVYESFCQESAEFKACYDAVQSQCNDEDVRTEYQSLLTFGEFLCSPETSSMLQDVANSECNTNVNLKSEIDQGFNNCYYAMIQELHAASAEALSNEDNVEGKDFCYYYEHFITCATTIINDKCGAVYSDFIRRFLQAAAQPRIGCALAKRNSRRSFPIFNF